MALKRSCVSCGVFASDAFARSKNLSAIIAAGSEDGFGLYVSVLGAITGGEEGVAEGVAAPACGIPAPIIDIMLPIVNGVSEDLLDLCFHTLDLVHRTRGCGESLHIPFIIRANPALMNYNSFTTTIMRDIYSMNMSEQRVYNRNPYYMYTGLRYRQYT